MDRFLKFFQLTKVDEAQRIVYGLVTAEREDKDGEWCHYDSTVPQYKAVNDEMGKATDGANIMPLREMHQLHAVGAGKSIEFDDSKKEIRMAFKVVEDSTWKKVMEKVLTGFSQGGRYIKKWKEDGRNYYTAEPGEVSLVDNPCLSGAIIEYAKADGTVESFKVPDPPLARLTDADIDRLSKAVADSILGTHAKEIDAALAERMRQQSAAKGENMKPEQIALCAKALGITVEEFTKQFITSDILDKGARGMAAVHGHLETLHEHHAEMGKCHKAMGGHHEKMGTHIEKCMKAVSDVMGSEGEKGEKAFKALLDELAAAKKTAEEIKDDLNKGASMKTEEVQALIDAAVTKTTETLTKAFDDKIKKLEDGLAPANGNTGGAVLKLFGRDGKEIATTDAAKAHSAFGGAV